MPRKYVANTCPIEDEECFTFHGWLELHNIPHTHIPNENAGSQDPKERRRMMLRMKKLLKMGLSKGFWDYEIFLPVFDCDGKVATYEIIFVEMKRLKGSTTSREQLDWGKIYEKAYIKHKVCKGAEEAIKFVKACALEISEATAEYLKDDVF